jgi:hypothetical protein
MNFFGGGSAYVAQVGLRIMILLDLLHECWDYRCATIPGLHSQLFSVSV